MRSWVNASCATRSSVDRRSARTAAPAGGIITIWSQSSTAAAERRSLTSPRRRFSSSSFSSTAPAPLVVGESVTPSRGLHSQDASRQLGVDADAAAPRAGGRPERGARRRRRSRRRPRRWRPRDRARDEPRVEAARLLGPAAFGPSRRSRQAAVGCLLELRADQAVDLEATPERAEVRLRATPTRARRGGRAARCAVAGAPTVSSRSQRRSTSCANASPSRSSARASSPANAVHTISFSRSRSRWTRAPSTARGRLASARAVRSAHGAVQKRRDAVARRERPVDVEGRNG